MFRQITHIAAMIILCSVVALGQGVLSSSEEEFIKNVSQGGLKEVELGKLAAKRGLSKEVKQLGKMMVAEHTKMNKELAKLAAKKKVRLAKEMDEERREDYNKLAAFSGKEFDEEYIEAMIDDHESEIKEFEDMAEDAEDAGVKQFAAKTLPTLKKHLQHIENLKQKMEAE